MNATCEWVQTSAAPMAQNFSRYAANELATLWVDSQEFRVVTVTIVLLACVMTWITSMVREIMRATTTVLCTLRVSDCAASGVPCNRTVRSDASASDVHMPHKTDGGPPPGLPPGQVQGLHYTGDVL